MRTERPDSQSDGTEDELLVELRRALGPEPLPEPLVDRIRADFDRRCQPSRRRGVPGFHLIGLVAAACLMVAVMLPSQDVNRADGRARSLELTSEEAAEIVAAFGAVAWDSPVDFTLSAVDTTLDDLERTLLGDGDDSRRLPWSRDDAWDVPLSTDEVPAESRTTAGGLCRAVFDRKQRG